MAEHEGRVVGLCHAQGVPLMANDGYAEVQALVVAQTHHRLGIGRAPLAQAQAWANRQGYNRIRLCSVLHREDAHRFYEALGFDKQRASFAFENVRRGL